MAPFNVVALTRRTRTLGLRDLLRVDARAAMRMLAYDGNNTYAQYDTTSAEDYLHSLRFPEHAKRMLFDVFAHSFFNPETTMSAAELLMMFHFYFMGNREGLVFDVTNQPMSKAIWQPMSEYLHKLGVTQQLCTRAKQVLRTGSSWRVETDNDAIVVDAVVVAVTVPALRELVCESPDLADDHWRKGISSLDVTSPFAVWRLWLDKPTQPGRAPLCWDNRCGHS